MRRIRAVREYKAVCAVFARTACAMPHDGQRRLSVDPLPYESGVSTVYTAQTVQAVHGERRGADRKQGRPRSVSQHIIVLLGGDH